MPPLLAGRGEEVALAEGRLRELAAGDAPSRGILLYGPRGNGKTVLLDRIAERAREFGLRAEDLPIAALRDEARLIRILQERAGLIADRLTGVQLGPLGGAAERATPSEDVSGLFPAWVSASDSPLVVLLDEIQALSPSAGRAFFEAAQLAGRESLPFLLIAAGTPDAPRRLREVGTFTERDLERTPIGRLEPEATAEALAAPARAAGRPLGSRALALLARESQDYPYFVQLLGSAAWNAAREAREPEVSQETAEEAVARVRPDFERFYAERFREAEERGLREALHPIASLFRERGGRSGDSELRALLEGLGGPADGWIALRHSLSDLGILWEISPGAWEMGIPSFGDHVIRREASPVAATEAR